VAFETKNMAKNVENVAKVKNMEKIWQIAHL
jgi:hypothetical protein